MNKKPAENQNNKALWWKGYICPRVNKLLGLDRKPNVDRVFNPYYLKLGECTGTNITVVNFKKLSNTCQ